jgi:hypothetical protein
MKKIFLLSLFLFVTIILYTSCQKFDFWRHQDGHGQQTKFYNAAVAVAWNKLQMKMSMSTPGFSPGVTARSFAYSGLALYESVQPAVHGYRSIASQLSSGLVLPAADKKEEYYWPASANKALAVIIKNLFAATSAANLYSIDSLEADFTTKFQSQAGANEIQRAVSFGSSIADAVFTWSKTDKSLDVYPAYVPPVGDGLWVPTAPAFAPAAAPYSGGFRTLVPGVAEKASAPPPIPYSVTPGSPFYEMVNEVYTASLSLTKYDTTTVRYWADLPGQFNGPAHFTSVLTQLIERENLNLIDAGIAYAKHGIAMNDAGIACFKVKYIYNLVRPITYIRTVIGHPDWNAVIATPPHPEYVSAHATNMQAAAEVLNDIFGKHYKFTDRTFETTYGIRSYNSFDEYAWEGMWSRIIGGIHYMPSGIAGLKQGKKAGELVNKLRFKD